MDRALAALILAGLTGLPELQAAGLTKSDAESRRAIVGTWRQDVPAKYLPLTASYVSYNTDGSFYQIWIVRLRKSEMRLDSRGTWRVENGRLVEKTTRASNEDTVGEVETSRILPTENNSVVLAYLKERVELRRGSFPAKLPPAFESAKELTQAILLDCALNAPEPTYPFQARQLRIEGRGQFSLIVNDAGIVTSVEVKESTKSRLLDEAAVSTLKRWRFKPGCVKRVGVPAYFRMR